MESVGVRLKNIRLSKGLSLEDVRKKTKLHLNILKAIEEDSLLGVSPVYTKGFIKIYCNFLGVDPKDFISDYKDPSLQPHISLGSKSQASGWKFPSFFKSGLVKLGVFKGIKVNRRSLLVVLAAAAALFFVSAAIKAISSGIKNNRRKAQMERQLGQQTVAQQPVSQGAQAQKSANRNALSSIRLSLRAKGDCWVVLKVDGRQVFRTVLKKGQVETWTAKEKMELSLGNAAAVELELDGRSIPPLGRKGQAIKDIKITREGGLVIR